MSHTSDLNYSSQFDSSPGPCTFDNSDSPEISFNYHGLPLLFFVVLEANKLNWNGF